MLNKAKLISNLLSTLPEGLPSNVAYSWYINLGRRGISTTAQCFQSPSVAEPFLNGSSSNYIEEMYESWLKDPTTVHQV